MAGAGALSVSGHPDKVAYSIRRRLEGLSPLSECCIFTIPKMLRQTNKEAYTPQVIAIGPYHRSSESLKLMEDHKLLYLQDFLRHRENQSLSLEDCTQTVKSLEDKIRRCYDKQIDLNSDQFTEMILLDSAFVIELLQKWERHEWRGTDRIFHRPWMLSDVCRDMALLENQIPFFVVQKLFDKASQTAQNTNKLLELVCSFFKPATGMKNMLRSVRPSDVRHFVDVIRRTFIPPESIMTRFIPPESIMTSYNNREERKFSPSAIDLVAAGVKLRRGESEHMLDIKSEHMLDIKFENGVLEIPQLYICDLTESYFRNIIAFDYLYHKKDRYVIDYMEFMDHLVDTSSDAKLLIDKGIIKNRLGSKEAVADLINASCKEVTPSEPKSYLRSISHDLVKHCEKPHNKWKATFKHDYCSSPWVVISVIAAVVLLLLTVVQTVFSVPSLK
ncbi:hypothetical protein EUGRSUZ_L02195 [Eucalyptus grandis]|uniref:Uncharacterized protein n=1 Tax=Eucalyptus grandis TaxID=71139 RepID=A0A058ZRD1_EUCGR|nr:hypothetical protein EUGRSUZ_L02195 [Eucalyptus grandis]